MYDGTRGGGKTECLLIDFYQDVGKWGPAWQGVIFRREYKELNDVVKRAKALFSVLCPEARFLSSGADYKYVFPGGEELLFRAAKTEDDYWSYHGSEIPWIAFEELTNWPDDGLYMAMMAVCRSTKSGMPRKFRATCNPYGVGHHWVKRRFVDPMGGQDFGRIVDPDSGRDRARIKGFWWENRHLVDNDPDYIRTLRADTNENRRKAWLEGDWDIVSGGMFSDVFETKGERANVLPVIDPREFKKAGWYIDRAFDWGSSTPFSVGFYAESNGKPIMVGGELRVFVPGSVIRFEEWYGCSGKPNEGLRLLNADIARGILDREEEMALKGKVNPGPADNQIHNVTDGDSIAKKMARAGVRWTRSDKAKGSRVNGWEIMRDMFQAAHPVDDEGEPIPCEEPGLFITQNCTDAIRIIPAAPRDDKEPDDIPKKSEDHIPDEMRYRVTAKKRATLKRSRLGGI